MGMMKRKKKMTVKALSYKETGSSTTEYEVIQVIDSLEPTPRDRISQREMREYVDSPAWTVTIK